jgi:hypothetical protein
MGGNCSLTGANPTIVGYNASLLKATKKQIFDPALKNALVHYNSGVVIVNSGSRRIWSRNTVGTICYFFLVSGGQCHVSQEMHQESVVK